MPTLKVATAESQVAKPSLPVPTVNAVFDQENMTLTVTSVFSFDYPDEAIINRLGRVPKDEKGNPTGEPKPITSKTYGRAKGAVLGLLDGEDNAMLCDIKVFANTKEAEAEAEAAEETE